MDSDHPSSGSIGLVAAVTLPPVAVTSAPVGTPLRAAPLTRASTLSILLLGALLLGACGADQAEDPAATTPSPQAMPPMPVTAAVVQPRSVAVEAEYPGRVHAVREVEVRARVAGILEERLYVEGEAVGEDDPLFRIDPEPFEIALQRVQAERADAAAHLEQAEREWRRVSVLYERGTASERERDQAETDHKLAEARLELADAAVADARRNLRYAHVSAPVDGVTGLESLPEGSLVDIGTLLTTITQLDPVYVRFSIPERDARTHRSAGRAASGRDARYAHPARLRLPDGREYELGGEVDFTDSNVDARTGTVTARAAFPNPNAELVPGQFVRVRVLLERLEDVFVIDPTTVGQGPRGPQVFVIENGDTARARPVTLGAIVDGGQVVLDGLRSGDRVVTNGQAALADGAAVMPQAANAVGG